MKTNFFSAAVVSAFLLSLSAWAQSDSPRMDPEDDAARAADRAEDDLERAGKKAGEKVDRAGKKVEEKAEQAGATFEEKAEQTGARLEGRDQKNQLSRADKEFVLDAAIGNLAEIELGKLAQKQAKRSDLKEYGERLVNDHEKANRDLERAVVPYGIMLPTRLDEAHQDKYDLLKAKKGDDFDRNFLTEMIEGHDKMVKMFKKASKQAKASQLKEYATDTLPALEKHLKMAREMEKPKAKTSSR